MTENAPQRPTDDQTDDASAGRTPHPGQPAEGADAGGGEGGGRTPHPEQPAEGADPATEAPGTDPETRVTGV
jgi:hypothetical protein